MLQALVDGWAEEGQALLNGAGVTRQIEDEGLATYAGGGPGENGGGDSFKVSRPHDFAEAWELLVQHGAGGFRSDITERWSGASRRDNQRTVEFVCEFAKGLLK